MTHLRFPIRGFRFSSRSSRLILGALAAGLIAGCGAKGGDGQPAYTDPSSSTTSSNTTPTSPSTAPVGVAPTSTSPAVAPVGPTGSQTGPVVGPTGSAPNTTAPVVPTGSTSTDTSTTGANPTDDSTTDTSAPTSDTGGAPVDDEDFDCVLPDLPESSALTYLNEKLPDPFTFFDGTKVTTKKQWECRRQEILAMADKYIYGPVPPAPDEVTGTVSGGNVSITAKVGDKTEQFSATISGNGDVIALELSGGIFPANRKRLTFGSGFEGKIRNLFGYSQVNPNVANGWMLDRVMDVLEKNPDSGHDPQKMMVSGCSGCGKGAYLAGVFSRVPLTAIVESGGGGASNLRQAQWFRHGEGGNIYQCADAKPQSIDNLEDNGICGPWVTSAASWLRTNPEKVYNLPFDQHLLLATIAPRYLVHFTNNHGRNSWCHLGGTSEALSAWAAEPVWNALGVPERMGFMMYSAQHCGNPREAVDLVNEFVKRAFQGDTSANTDVMQIMSDGVQQPVSEWKDMWIDWDMETTLQ